MSFARRALIVLAVIASARGADADSAQERIDKSVERGVKALRQLQQENGAWGSYGAGSTSLAGLALLECGAKADDPAITKAAAYVRDAIIPHNEVYHISLALMFLDRIGEPGDVPLIQALAVRLMEAQFPSPQAGWNYRTLRPSAEEIDRLRSPRKSVELKTDANKKEGSTQRSKLDPDLERRIEALEKFGPVPPDRRADGSQQAVAWPDNSNSQFAVLALWIGRRHGVPTEYSLRRAEYWYRVTYDNGTWTYQNTSGAPFGRASTTCAGLIGLAVGAGVARTPAMKTEPDGKAIKPSKRDPLADIQVQTALNHIGAELAAVAVSGIAANGASERDYYFLWSFERVAMIYSLAKVGSIDWHTIGAGLILAHQQPNGTWKGRYAPEIDTSFALLFLRRSNLVTDLTNALRTKQQPALTAKESTIDESGVKSSAESSAAQQADRLVQELLTAAPERQERILERLRDEKGPDYSDALVKVIPRLAGDVQVKARDFLAERLARMTAGTLRDKLRDKNAEFRRAAALACAAKEDRSLVRDLIVALDDADFAVVRAAAVALRSLTGEDFGPTTNATLEERSRAIAAWKAWWKKQLP